MTLNDPAIFFLGIVLPGLFALTLIVEGITKVLRDEPGWVPLVLGVIFFIVIAAAYFFFLR